MSSQHPNRFRCCRMTPNGETRRTPFRYLGPDLAFEDGSGSPRVGAQAPPRFHPRFGQACSGEGVRSPAVSSTVHRLGGITKCRGHNEKISFLMGEVHRSTLGAWPCNHQRCSFMMRLACRWRSFGEWADRAAAPVGTRLLRPVGTYFLRPLQSSNLTALVSLRTAASSRPRTVRPPRHCSGSRQAYCVWPLPGW